MSFQFESLQAFWQMNGHGPYVWACYAITLVSLVFLVAYPLVQKKQFIVQQKKWLLLQQEVSAKQTSSAQSS